VHIQNDERFGLQPLLRSDEQESQSRIVLCAQALLHNALNIKALIPPSAQLAFVVKANGYGHGLVEIAQMAESIDAINWFCVFHLSEALALRKGNIKKPILVAGNLDADLALLVGQNIACMVDTVDQVLKINVIGLACGQKLPVHIKIDTGLSRFGLQLDEIDDFFEAIAPCSWVTVQGMYTHFAESQVEDQSYTDQQEALFEKAIAQVKSLCSTIQYVHAYNSAATLIRSVDKYNFFRVGLGLYGYFPSPYIKNTVQKKLPNFNLKPVLRLESSVVRLKTVPAGSYVGYNRTMKTTRTSTFAFVPFGYADGYELLFSGNAHALVNGNTVPTIGRITMNVVTLDVTECQNEVQVGARVVFCGQDIFADTLCGRAGISNVRTFLARLSPAIIRKICNPLDHGLFCTKQ
jgi:alanine racemase